MHNFIFLMKTFAILQIRGECQQPQKILPFLPGNFQREECDKEKQFLSLAFSIDSTFSTFFRASKIEKSKRTIALRSVLKNSCQTDPRKDGNVKVRIVSVGNGRAWQMVYTSNIPQRCLLFLIKSKHQYKASGESWISPTQITTRVFPFKLFWFHSTQCASQDEVNVSGALVFFALFGCTLSMPKYQRPSTRCQLSRN